MAYKPSSKLLSNLMPDQNQGYRPSTSLLSTLIPNEEMENNKSSINPEQGKQAFIEATKRADPLGILTSGIYGFGKAGSNIAKMFDKNAPNMPDIRMGNPSKLAEVLGQYLPFGIGGGSSVAGSTAGAGTFGFTQHEPGQINIIDKMLGLPPGGRVRNAVEDAVINAATHGLMYGGQKLFGNKLEIPQVNFKNQVQFQPGESEFTNIPFQPPKFLAEQHPSALSENIANQLHADITGKKSLEESGKDLAKMINDTYNKQYDFHTGKYKSIFENPTKEISAFTGEPFKVKEIRLDNSNYLKSFRDMEFTDKGLKSLHSTYIENPVIENAHWLQSEMGSEIGYLKNQKAKGLLDDAGKNKLKEYVSGRNMIKKDIRNGLGEIDPKLQDEYDAVSESWRQNIEPYHSNKKLKNIATGKTTNPTTNEITSIFKNPEENILTVAAHLPPEAKKRIVHIGIGKNHEQNTANDLLSGRNALERKGLSTYINPHYDQAFKNIKNNISMEKEATEKAASNQKLIEILKNEQTRAEQARISAAKTREKLKKLSEKESSKTNTAKQKELQTSYESTIKKQRESQLRRSSLIRSALGGAAGYALVHGFGVKPEDILGTYLGKLMTGKR